MTEEQTLRAALEQIARAEYINGIPATANFERLQSIARNAIGPDEFILIDRLK
jgi:hypothetical protein